MRTCVYTRDMRACVYTCDMRACMYTRDMRACVHTPHHLLYLNVFVTSRTELLRQLNSLRT
jgi:hypothetical protein